MRLLFDFFVQKEDSTAMVEVLSTWHPNLTINLIDDHTPWVKGSVPQPLDECESYALYFAIITSSLHPYHRWCNKIVESLQILIVVERTNNLEKICNICRKHSCYFAGDNQKLVYETNNCIMLPFVNFRYLLLAGEQFVWTDCILQRLLESEQWIHANQWHNTVSVCLNLT